MFYFMLQMPLQEDIRRLLLYSRSLPVVLSLSYGVWPRARGSSDYGISIFELRMLPMATSCGSEGKLSPYPTVSASYGYFSLMPSSTKLAEQISSMCYRVRTESIKAVAIQLSRPSLRRLSKLTKLRDCTHL